MEHLLGSAAKMLQPSSWLDLLPQSMAGGSAQPVHCLSHLSPRFLVAGEGFEQQSTALFRFASSFDFLNLGLLALMAEWLQRILK